MPKNKNTPNISITGDIDHRSGQVPGSYVIKFPVSGDLYAGSTKNLYQRLAQHRTSMASGTHLHTKVQEAFDRDKQCVIEVTKTESLEQARKNEQLFLDENIGKPGCLNLSPNAEVAFKGLSHSEATRKKLSERHTGHPLSEEHRNNIREAQIGHRVSNITRAKLSATKFGKIPYEDSARILKEANEKRSKPVIVDGVEYSSVNVAAKTFGVDNRTVENRANSNTGRFDNWKFKEKHDDSE